jgi:hypothetical protein
MTVALFDFYLCQTTNWGILAFQKAKVATLEMSKLTLHQLGLLFFAK